MFLQGDGVPSHFLDRILVQDHRSDRYVLVHTDREEDLQIELLLRPVHLAHTQQFCSSPPSSLSFMVFQLCPIDRKS